MIDSDKQFFARPITEIITSRRSVRTYLGNPLTDGLKQRISEYIKEIQARADIEARFELIDSDVALNTNGARLGTYGVIKGASSYIIPAVNIKTDNIERFGYLFEKVILFAASIGLGTCWMAMTFKGHEFAQAIGLKPDEFIPIVTPIGYPKNVTRPIDAIFRLSAGSNSRKDWNQIFFNGDFTRPLNRDESRDYTMALEMLRLAPSASNHQPWRIVKDNNTFHFYLQRTKGYRNKYVYDIQRLDVGIAMCHFELTLNEMGIKGTWLPQEPRIKNVPDETLYITSWVRE
ncbi:MAG: nitroreductase family protein [Chitinophagales bacterium]